MKSSANINDKYVWVVISVVDIKSDKSSNHSKAFIFDSIVAGYFKVDPIESILISVLSLYYPAWRKEYIVGFSAITLPSTNVSLVLFGLVKVYGVKNPIVEIAPFVAVETLTL